MSIARMDFAREAVAVVAVVGVYYGVLCFCVGEARGTLLFVLCYVLRWMSRPEFIERR